MLTAAVLLSGCQAAPVATVAEPVPVNGVGFIVLNGPIAPVSRDAFVADVDKLADAGAREIDIGMNSPGGSIDAAQGIVDYMAQRHERSGTVFKVYNIGLVASAATYIFLNAQARYTVANAAFLFHAAGMVSSGPVNAENLRDSADKLDAYERTMRSTLKRRTRLTDAETLTYVRRTVVLNADDARRDGVVDGIAAFVMPTGGRAWVIQTKQVARPVARPATPPS